MTVVSTSLVSVNWACGTGVVAMWVGLDLSADVGSVYTLWQLLSALSSSSLPTPPVPGGFDGKNSGTKHIPIPLSFLLFTIGSYITPHIFCKPSGIIISGTLLACLSSVSFTFCRHKWSLLIPNLFAVLG